MIRKKNRGPESLPDPGPRPLTDGALPPNGAGLDDDQLELIEKHEAQVALSQAEPSRRLERGVGLALVALSLLGIYGSQNIVLRNNVTELVGPKYWPTMLCLISLILSIALAVVSFTKPPFERDGVEASSRTGWFRVAATLVLEFLFIVAWYLSGNFAIPGVLLLFAMLWLYGTRKWLMLVIFPIASIAFIYALFDLLLKIPL